MIKKLFFLMFLLLLSFYVCAEEKKQDVSTIKKAKIENLEISPNPVGKGDLFTITLILDHSNSTEVDFPLKDLPEDLLLWRGPYIRSFVDSDREGNTVRKVRITTTFKALSSGRMIIPPLSVIIDGKEILTEPHLLKVGLYKSRKLYMPLEVEWQSGFEKVYAGEAVPLYLMVLNQELVTIFNNARVAYPRDGFFEKVGGIAEITSFGEGGITLYDIPAASYMLTSPVAGEVIIPSAGVDYEGITGWTENLALRINRIPAAINDSGAIGQFSYTSSVDRQSVTAGEDLILTVSVSGDGNLNYLKVPEPAAEGFILSSSEEINNYDPSPLGFSGSKTVKWMFTAETPGRKIINIPSFNYLDKPTDLVKSLGGNNYQINIMEAVAVTEEIEINVFPYKKVDTSLSKSAVWQNYYRSYFRYGWILPGLVFFLISLIMKGQKLLLATVLSAIILIAIFSFARVVIPAEARNSDNVRSDILYNDALDAYYSGNITESLHNLRAAVYHDPVNSLYRETLTWIEVENGFVNPVSPSVRMHPDIFYYILMIVINLLFFTAVFRLVRPGAVVSVLIILFVFSIVFSSVMIGYNHIIREKMTAVVCGDGSSLKKIPSNTASDWVPLAAGTALKLIDSSEEYILVETGLGVKGWISESCIVLDR